MKTVITDIVITDIVITDTVITDIVITDTVITDLVMKVGATRCSPTRERTRPIADDRISE
jgi:hypothetical protein